MRNKAAWALTSALEAVKFATACEFDGLLNSYRVGNLANAINPGELSPPVCRMCINIGVRCITAGTRRFG
jgi:hypothetical protein